MSPLSRINRREVWRLEENPAPDIAPLSPCFDDGRTSTFGAPNAWGDQVQDLTPLREGRPPQHICDELDETDRMFAPDRVLDVEIAITPEDWDALRFQTRDLMETFGGACFEGPHASPFPFFRGDLRIDGELIEGIGIRKKGFLGSIEHQRPSLKLDFSEFGVEETLHGLDRMTLNNQRQDPSRIDACLGYTLFRAAALPAPRCNFARVRVNGESLGIYAHVESINPPFLARAFGDATGSLYEGTTADFREPFIRLFEAKNGGDGADLAELASALALEDDTAMLAAVERLVDVDRFLTYWAVEGLVGHWDGYASRTNNFWLYANPVTGLFEFIPWGLDSIFGAGKRGAPRAATVWDDARLSQRLWQHPDIPARYEQRIEELLVEIWDVDALLAEIGRMETLIEPFAGDVGDAIGETAAWIESRPDDVEEDFAAGPPTLGGPLPGGRCLARVGRLEADFETLFGGGPGFLHDVALELNGPQSVFEAESVVDFAGPLEEDVIVRAVVTTESTEVLASGFGFRVAIPSEWFVPSPDGLVDIPDSPLAELTAWERRDDFQFHQLGFVVGASWQLETGVSAAGSPVEGHIEGDLAVWVPEPSSNALAATCLITMALLQRRALRGSY